MIAETIAIGSELLSPFRQDTNSLFLTERLNELGIEVTFKTVVGDNQTNLVNVARIALNRVDIVIFMGGLGPTEDDLTHEAVAEAMRLPLRRNPDIVAGLYAWYASRRLKMPEVNLKQADVLTGAAVLANKNGTAPGQWLEGMYEGKEKIVMLLPGPPVELKALFMEQCFERLREKAPPQVIATRVLKVAMMGESQVDQQIAPIYKEHNAVETTILAAPGEVQIHLKARAETMEEAQSLIHDLVEELEDELDEHIFSSKGETLEQIVGYYLQMRAQTLAVAESCTGGLLSQRITAMPGSSRYFLGGAVVYSNELKTAFADVPPLLIAEHGAVSKEVAVAMAEGIRARCKATIGVGVTGIAGPTGGTPEKPVGLVFIAVTDGKKPEVLERKFPGDRDRVRHFAAQQALDMIRRKLA
ncbi:MAG: competence/damage-inducible protein A [Terriglobales bacterium]